MSQTNISLIREALKKRGIVNETLINGILAVVGKESNFKPQSENLNYSAKRIREVWPYIKEAEAAKLANNPQALGNKVYGGKYGNTAPSDGFAYRGRGFNQVTFKGQYFSLGNKLGVDLLNNPDLLNDPKIAAAALAEYYAGAFKSGAKFIKDFYKIDINSLLPGTDPRTLLMIATNANSGWKKARNIVEKEYNKALVYFDQLQKLKGETITQVKKAAPMVLPLILLGVLLLLFNKK
jgi:predicted chitinase